MKQKLSPLKKLLVLVIGMFVVFVVSPPTSLSNFFLTVDAQTGRHIRLFIDGIDRGSFFSTNPIPVSNLSSGQHAIALRLYEANGTYIGVEDTVNVTVSGSTSTPTRTNTVTPQPTGGGGGAAPYNFGPFDPNISLIELQGWWAPIREDGLSDNGLGFGHLHILCKWPAGRNITSNFTTNCRLTMHDNPSKMTVLRLDLAPGDTKQSFNLSNLPPGSPQSAAASCFYNDGLGSGSTNCSWNVPLTVDISSWPTGWDHLRLRYTVQTADGKRWTTSSEIPFQIRGGTNVHDGGFASCLKDCFIAKSWYDGFDYQRVRLHNVPFDRPVSGVHTFYTQAWKGDSPRTQRLMAVLDRSHFIPAVGPWPQENAAAGPVLLDVQNPNPSTVYPLVVDTTKLANGWHSIAARTIEEKPGISTCSYCSAEDNFQVAVGKFYFYVQN
jgi:hypothetical protein